MSHYWDCRLKGRPPGTAKSSDPNKKKRKRTARARDLCDVKIKITEHFPSTGLPDDFDGPLMQSPMEASNNFFSPGQPGGAPLSTQSQQFGVLAPPTTFPLGHPGAVGQRYYTIQRVNGNGTNGKADGPPGPHQHTLEESDRVKKNSVQRYFLKQVKDSRKSQVCSSIP